MRPDGEREVARRNGSVVRQRQLGRTLRELREEAGLTLEEAAPRLDWSTSKLSRIEIAQQSIDVHGVRSMLDLYGVGGERWTQILELTRQARERGWWRAYGLTGLGYVAIETEATLVRDFTLGFVPGLLQTADYAHALFTASLNRRTDAQRENQIAVRMIRQERLTSTEHPLALVAIVEESVLYRPVGGAEVMRAQHIHLMEAAELPTVTLQVLPGDIGAHPGLDGAFTLLSFGELDEPDVAYVEHPMGAVHLQKEADVARATLVFDGLRSDALSPTDSGALIRRLVEGSQA
ncbi:MAG: helix-turn-helix domain-containing protein [Pseudonocardiales bacterium]|nr:helix-turn-helix domain-containing protein [Pseudonocardiales bacterium]